MSAMECQNTFFFLFLSFSQSKVSKCFYFFLTLDFNEAAFLDYTVQKTNKKLFCRNIYAFISKTILTLCLQSLVSFTFLLRLIPC